MLNQHYWFLTYRMRRLPPRMQLSAFLVLVCVTTTVYSKSILPLKERAKPVFVNNGSNAAQGETSADAALLLDKIVGGNNATPGLIPWQASVKNEYLKNGVWTFIHACGATIIGEYWLVSAAHCFVTIPRHKFRVNVGEISLSKEDPGEQVFEVENIYTHELYGKEKPIDYDVALIKIKPSFDGRGIKYSETVRNACIYRYALPPVNTPLNISGWGGLIRQPSEKQETPDILQYASVPLIDQRECEMKYPNKITDRMFCAGYPDKEINTCQGDSGGPVIYQIGDDFALYGITSWADGCALTATPTVFARVAAFYDWIGTTAQLHSDNVNQESICMK